METTIHGSLIPILLAAIARMIDKGEKITDCEYTFDSHNEMLRVTRIFNETVVTEDY